MGYACNLSAKLPTGLAGKQEALHPGQGISGISQVAVCAVSAEGLVNMDCVRDKCLSATSLLTSIGLNELASRGIPQVGRGTQILVGVQGRQQGHAGTQVIHECVCACEPGECCMCWHE